MELTAAGVPVTMPPSSENPLALAGKIANEMSHADRFTSYQQQLTDNTRRRQYHDLQALSSYLTSAGIERPASDLMVDPLAWQGMTYGIVRGFVVWSLQQGYSIGTINVRLATLRQYCRLAGPPPEGAGIIAEQDLAALLTVKGYAGKQARNVDQDRAHHGLPTRKGAKKREATPLTSIQALTLKKTTTSPHKGRHRDKGNSDRDALLMGLLIEHALRVSEIAALNIEHLNLTAGTLMVYRQKTNQTDTHRLMHHTRLAAESYLAQLGRTSGPLFVGYQSKRLSVRAINDRVHELGQLVGLSTLSPHDLRHFWAFDALRNGTPIDQVKSGGGWRSESMVLRYARQSGIANAGVRITEGSITP